MMRTVLFLILVLCSSVLPAETFHDLLQDETLRPGLCVVVGCGNAEALVDSQLNGKYVVQGVCADKNKAGAIREELVAKGVYGKISVTQVVGNRLPYVDNLVNVIVVVNQGKISREETMRVVAPYGTALFKQNGTWKKVTKTYPQDMDEWPQPRHDAANSNISRDALVAPPTRLQWLTQEKYDREDLVQLLSAGGRNFYTFSNGKVVARDAFNGIRLWEQASCGFPWASTEEFLFTTIRGRLATIDTVTGEIHKTEVRASNTSSLNEGMVYTANGAYDLERETFLWQNDDPKRTDGAPLVAEGRLIIVTSLRLPNPEIICRDAKTGKDLWRIPASGTPSLCHRGKLLIRGKQKSETVTVRNKERTTHVAVNHCVDLKDGTLLWTIEFCLPTHHGAATMFCIDDTVWVRPGKLGGGFGTDEFWRACDLQTGKILREIPTIQSMHRCFEPRATERFILGTGIDYLDHTTDETYAFHGARGDCGLGTIPANGMLYQFPNMCMCMGQVDGVSGISSHSLSDPAESALKLSDLLEKGPAYGTIANNEDGSLKSWPSLRGNNARLGSNQAKLPDALEVLWEQSNPVQPSSPVAANGAVYVALRDSYAVSAFAASDGQLKWTFIADGPIDSPPTLAGNAVVFGGEDGWIYVVRAADGKLAWRFRAAPEERVILTDEHPASAWPLHGSLLVEDGVIHAAAGHHNELDGGLFTYALELETGNIVWGKRLIRGGVTQNIELSEIGDTGNTILSSDGETLYMELLHLDLETGVIEKSYPNGKIFFCGGWPEQVIWGGPQGYLLDLSLPSYTSGHSSSDWIWGKVRANMVAVNGDVGYGIITLHGKEVRHRKTEPLFKDGPAIVFCAKQVEADKGWSEYIPQESLIWKCALPEGSIARTVIKTAGQVIVAFQTVEEDGAAAGVILQLDPATGEETGRLALSAAPRWDGLAAAGNRLYLITEENALVCLGAR